MHAISAVKGFVRVGGDQFGGSLGRGDAGEGRSGMVGERRTSRKRRREGERKGKIVIETERSQVLCIFMVMVHFYDRMK